MPFTHFVCIYDSLDVDCLLTRNAVKANMIVKPSHLRPIPQFLLPFSAPSSQIRSLSLASQASQSTEPPRAVKIPKIPQPTPFVPDVPTFLSLIGRNLSQHAAKIPSWRALFSLTSHQLEELGVGPPRNRRYLLLWRDKFRKGQYGPGGSLEHVKGGEAELQIVENSNRKIIVNVPVGGSASDLGAQPEKVAGLKIKHGNIITGPYVLPVKGNTGAKIVVKEGMWEIKRGRKIDGGERRRAEVQAKRRGEEKKSR